MISTGLPASAAIRSLLKSIWSVMVPRPDHPHAKRRRGPRRATSARSDEASRPANRSRGRRADPGAVRSRRDRLDVGERARVPSAAPSGRPVGEWNSVISPGSRRCVRARLFTNFARAVNVSASAFSYRWQPIMGRAPNGPPARCCRPRSWLPLPGRQVAGLEDHWSALAQDLDGIAIEPRKIVAFRPVPDCDRVDRGQRARRPPTRDSGYSPSV